VVERWQNCERGTTTAEREVMGAVARERRRREAAERRNAMVWSSRRRGRAVIGG
jgi:hypothetical protein